MNNISSWLCRLAKPRNVLLCILLQVITANAWGVEVLNDGTVRFGSGSENSVNILGNLQQPFYYDTNAGSWYKLTYSNYALDNAIGLGGDGSSEWNINGEIDSNPVLTDQVIDTSGFITTTGNNGVGVIVSTGTVTIGEINLEVKNTYDLTDASSFVKITTKITNTSGNSVTNLRVWVGTRDDWVGRDDGPTKVRGNLVDGVFANLTTAAEKATALKITSEDTGVLFLTTSTKATTSIKNCCSFSNVITQNPETADITKTGDGSYGFYVRMDDLVNGASEEFSWYYGAGELTRLDEIIASISQAAYTSKVVDEDSILTFTTNDFKDVNDVTFDKIKVTSLPNVATGVLKLNGNDVYLNQEISSDDYSNLTYTPVENIYGSEDFTWQGYANDAYTLNSTVTIGIENVNDAPSITSVASNSVSENQISAIDVNATDIDVDDTLSFSLSDTDATFFNIDSLTGVVTFKVAPDFETKADDNADNVYEFIVTATDNGTDLLTDTQNISITVTDVVALAEIEGYAASNTYPQPSLQDYIDTGITGVDAANLNAINAAIEAADALDADSIGEIQAIVTTEIALAKIVAYAADNTSPLPSVQDYIDASITGVDADNLNAVNAGIEASDDAGVDTLAKIQTIAETGNTTADTSLAKIVAYAADNTSPLPSVQEYIDSGITGVDAANLNAVNAGIDGTDATGTDTVTKVQTIATTGNTTADTALALIAAYAVDNTSPLPSVQDYIDSGIIGVDAANLNAVNAGIDGTDATGTDTVTKVQTIATTGNTTADTALAIIAAYAADNTSPLPSVQDYIDAGITGVDAANLNAVNAGIEASDDAGVDTLAKIQTIAETGNTTADTALAIIAAYAADNTSPLPSVQDYIDSGITGVDAANLNAVNAGIDGTDATGTDTVAKVQTIATTGDVTADTALALIAAYAADNTSPLPSVQDYIDAGIAGVDAANLNAVNAGIEASDDAGVDTLAKIQTIAETGNTTADTALAIIAAYAADNTSPLPSVQDYIDAGITGVDAANLNAVNAGIDGTDATGTDTVAKVQTIATTGNTTADTALALIAAYAADNTSPLPSVQDYIDAGIAGVDAANLNAVNAGIDGTDATGTDTVTKVQTIATTGNTTADTALALIAAYAADNTSELPSVQDYIEAGITGVDADNLNAVNAGIDGTDATGTDIVTKVQTIATTGNTTADTALALIAAYAVDNTSPLPSVQDYIDAGITGVDADNLNAVNAGIDGTDATGTDTVAKVQTIATAGDVTADTALAKIKGYAQNSGTSPTVQDYIDAGITDVDATNLVAVNAGIDAVVGTDADTTGKIQTIVAIANAALTKISAYAADNTNTLPSVQDYIDAGITGVDAANLNAVNAGIDGTDATGTDTVAKVQTIATAGDVTADTALAIIAAYAADNTSPLPSVQDYIDAGITDVDAANLNAVNAGIEASDDAGVDTLAKIQTIAETGNTTADTALAIIADYAADNTSPLPSVQDYIDSGITGVDAANLNAVNAGIDGTDATGTDTVTKVQTIATTGNTTADTALAKINDYAQNGGTPPSVQDYIDAGITGVDTDNLNAVNAGVEASDDAGVDTLAKIQTIAVTGDTTADTALAKIASYATDSSNPAPNVQDYIDAGVTGVDIDSLNSVNIGISVVEATDTDTVAKVQFIATIGNTNLPPVAVNDSYNLTSTDAVNLDVLANDSDDEGGTIELVSAQTDKGQVDIVDSNVVYTPEQGASGTFTIIYSIKDNLGSFATANVEVVIASELTPVITLPQDLCGEFVVNAEALYTRVDVGEATAVDRFGNSLPVSLKTGQSLYPPGLNEVFWQTTDNEGNTSIAKQLVCVRPIISIEKNQTVLEGETSSIGFYLNGESPVYPMTIPFNVIDDSEDTNLVSGEVVIESGTHAYLSFDVLTDDLFEGNETVEVSIAETVNIGEGFTHILTITEGNIAPEISLKVTQANEQRLTVSQVDGSVVITSSVYDPNNDDTHDYLWSSTDGSVNNISENESQFMFEPSELDAGVYSFSLQVNDSASPQAEDVSTIYINVLPELVVLGSEDSDGDLIPDDAEGYADKDGDGIPDYLDRINECNVLQQEALIDNGYLIEGQSGVCLRRGDLTFGGESGGAQIIDADIETTSSNGLISDPDAINVGGIFDYIAYGLPEVGQSLAIVMPQRKPIPDNAVYRKYRKDSGWIVFIEDAQNSLWSTQGEPGYCPPPSTNTNNTVWTLGLTEGHWCVQQIIEDGGVNDDDDEINGTIVDPGGVSVMLSSNHLPVAFDDSVNLLINSDKSIDVLMNDTDEDGDVLVITSATTNIGTVSIVNEQLYYVSANNYDGDITVNYGISDNNGGSDHAVVIITVLRNEPPVVIDESSVMSQGGSISINLLANDTDPEGDVLSLISVDNTNVIFSDDGQATFTPSANFYGDIIIAYTAQDSAGNLVSGQWHVSVTEVIEVSSTTTKGGGVLFWPLFLLIGCLITRRRSQG